MRGEADFADATFFNKALFDRVIIDGDDTKTDYTVFADAVSFSAAIFDHFANFYGTSFLKTANFNGTIFNSKTFFEGVSLSNRARYVRMSFKNTHFGIYTSISDVSIEGEFIFESVTCDGELFVSGTRFLKSPTLSDLIVNGYTTFQRLEFEDDAKKMSVIRSTFHGDLDVDFLVRDMDKQNLRTLLLSTCWITGHLHIAGAVNLIDEYDSPFNSTYDRKSHEKILKFLRSMLYDALKGNDSLGFAVITGVMQISKESIFSGLDNIFVNNIFSTASD